MKGKESLGKILVVDDELKMCKSLKTLLSQEGYQVKSMQDGRKAIQTLKQKDFDLVITDIKMPGCGGIDILKAAKEKDKDALVILMTGFGSLESAVSAINQGAYDYLLKPVDFSELELSIKRGLERKKLNLAKNRLLEELKTKNKLLKKRVGELNALYQSAKSLSSTDSLEVLLKKIIDLATKVIGAKIGSVMLLNEKEKILQISAAIGLEPEVIKNTNLRLGKSIAGWVAEEKIPLMVENVEKDHRFKRINKEKYETKSLLSVPLVVKERALGVINLSNKVGGKVFTQDDLRLLTTFASQAAIAIDDAYHFQSNRKKIKELSILYQIASSLSKMEEFEKIFRLTFQGLREIMDVDFCGWFDLNERDKKLTLSFWQDREKDKRDFPKGVEMSLNEDDLFENQKLNQKIKSQLQNLSLLPSKLNSFTSVPIVSEGIIHGLVCVGNFGGKPLSEEEVNIISIIASQASSIYERQRAILNSTQLITMGRMISEISHDLKRPMTNIKGTLQILKEKCLEEKDRQLFEAAEEEIYRLTELVQEIVNFSDPNKYNLQKTSILKIVEKALRMVKEDLSKGKIELKTKFQKDLPLVFINENAVLDLFLNVILNAIESMPRGGNLELNIDTFYHPQKEDAFLRVEVKDTGVGILKENLDRIFDRYFTTKSDGTGLGLAIVDRIIKAHNGFVEVKSQKGRGTSFYINLPLEGQLSGVCLAQESKS
jgi:signal transduction histidine kinase/DNA-binding response OmpR family regulator/putative methionine-R-sulfoxide reductase with GAF domain